MTQKYRFPVSFPISRERMTQGNDTFVSSVICSQPHAQRSQGRKASLDLPHVRRDADDR